MAVVGKYRTYLTPTQDNVNNGFKHCFKCDKDKPVAEFGKRASTTCGYASWCKVCSRKYDKDNAKRFALKHANRWYLRKYGISLEEVNDLLVKQNNKCAICEQEFGNERWTKARVDHAHDIAVVRGLLCNKCNIGLGHFNDSVDLLNKAVLYMENSFGKEK